MRRSTGAVRRTTDGGAGVVWFTALQWLTLQHGCR